jgi:Domain of unknown function (DUF4367)
VGHNTIIELNGKQYDAITGALVGESRIKATPESRAHMVHQGRTIDGFVRQKPVSPVLAVASPSKVAGSQPATQPSTKHFDIQRPGLHPAKAHQPERSQTLMRHIVKKPDTKLKTAIKTTGPAEMMPKPESSLTKQLEKKMSVTQVSPIRLARANHVAKSQHIHRFTPDRREATRSLAGASVRPVQRAAVATRPVQQDMRGARPIKSRSIALEQAAKNLHARQKATNMFEEALVHATSHEEPTHKMQGKRARNHRRLVSALAGVGALLIMAGFLAYLNMPKLEVRFASIHAGFQAELPGYKPTGYALDGGVKASGGKVQLTYRSGDSSYTVTQAASNWNSQTLLDQNTEQRGAPTQTIQSEGRIIYIYGNSASWVNSGVHYEVNGNANLNPDDLVSLADSM